MSFSLRDLCRSKFRIWHLEISALVKKKPLWKGQGTDLLQLTRSHDTLRTRNIKTQYKKILFQKTQADFFEKRYLNIRNLLP